jgi:hypothetical protein
VRTSTKRFVTVATLGIATFLIAFVVATREATKTAPARANEAVVEATDDAGPPKDASLVASFGPVYRGSPTWSTVTYSTSSGQCFDANAEWNGIVVGSVGGCGFGDDVDAVLRAMSAGSEPADVQAMIRNAAIDTPLIVAEGFVASPDESVSYGFVTGIASCDCVVTARWADGAVVHAAAANGIFFIQRNPVVISDKDTARTHSVTSVSVS